jgi:hypothetical protein
VLDQVTDNVTTDLVAFFSLVLVVVDPVTFGVERTGLADHIRRAELAGERDNLLESFQIGALRVGIGMYQIGVAGDAADREIGLAECLADLSGGRLVQCLRGVVRKSRSSWTVEKPWPLSRLMTSWRS